MRITPIKPSSPKCSNDELVHFEAQVEEAADPEQVTRNLKIKKINTADKIHDRNKSEQIGEIISPIAPFHDGNLVNLTENRHLVTTLEQDDKEDSCDLMSDSDKGKNGIPDDLISRINRD